MYTNRVFVGVNCVLFIEVSLFRGVLNKDFLCMAIAHYMGVCH